MNAAALTVEANPFPERLPDLGEHGADCAGPERRAEYVTFPDRPAPPHAWPGVVLVGGHPGLGKSVFTHRCLHRYLESGHRAIDLAADSALEYPGPDAVLRALRARPGARGPAAVRLPPADPSLRATGIADQVLAYARTVARKEAGAYLFEFAYWKREADWRPVVERIEEDRLAPLVTIVELAPFSIGELEMFLDARLDPGHRFEDLFDLEPQALFRMLTRNGEGLRPNSVFWSNALCRAAFEAAADDGADRIGVRHLLAAAIGIGAP